jgi:hypothetical protein
MIDRTAKLLPDDDLLGGYEPGVWFAGVSKDLDMP